MYDIIADTPAPSLATALFLATALVSATGCDDSDAQHSHAEQPPAPLSATPSSTPATPPAADQLSTFAMDQLAGDSLTLVRYHCADDLVVTVEYSGYGAALTLGGERHELYQEPAASGVRYSNDDVSWHTKAQEGMLSAGDDSRVCLQLAP